MPFCCVQVIFLLPAIHQLTCHFSHFNVLLQLVHVSWTLHSVLLFFLMLSDCWNKDNNLAEMFSLHGLLQMYLNISSLYFQTEKFFLPPLFLSCVVKVQFEAPVLLMSNEANQPNPVMMMSSETRPPRWWRSGPGVASSLPVSHDSLGGLTRLANSTVQILPQSQASCSLKNKKHDFAYIKKEEKKILCTERNLPDV